MSYTDKVRKDLDRWQSQGLLSSDQVKAISDTLPTRQRFNTSLALMIVSGFLIGAAVITFIAANWDGLPRLVRFVGLLVLILASAGIAAQQARRNHPALRDTFLTICACTFAAGIGLIGQMYQISGNPVDAVLIAGLGAVGLGLAGRSGPPLILGLVAAGIAATSNVLNTDPSLQPLMAAQYYFALIVLAAIATMKSLREETNLFSAAAIIYTIAIIFVSIEYFSILIKDYQYEKSITFALLSVCYLALCLTAHIHEGKTKKLISGFKTASGCASLLSLNTLIAITYGFGIINLIICLIVNLIFIAFGNYIKSKWITAFASILSIICVFGITSTFSSLLNAAAIFIAIGIITGFIAMFLKKQTETKAKGDQQ